MKILIIDDEKLARDILRNQLQSFSDESILEAENGIRGIEILREELPDVVFVDIRMPEMSGLELMEQALAISGRFIFIVLSGYNLFEYAQQAIELGAYQYLLKPIDKHKLEAAMNGVKEKIMNRNTKTERFNNNLVLLRENGIYLESSYFKVVFITLQGVNEITANPSDPDMELIQFGIENIVTEILNGYHEETYLFCDGKMTGILINTNHMLETEQNKEIWEEIFCKVKKFVQAFTAAEITIGIGRDVSGLEKVQEAYLSAQEAVKQQIIHGSNAIYYAREERTMYKKIRRLKSKKNY